MNSIVFFDIDGTILNENKQIPLSTLAAIEKLQQKGIYTAIATGRGPFMFEDLRRTLKIDSYVSFNGQFVVVDNEPIYKNPLQKEKIHELTLLARRNDHPLVFMTNETMRANHSDHSYIHEGLNSLLFNHPPYDPQYYEKQDVYQSLLFCQTGEEQVYLEKFTDFQIIRWHNVSVDIIPKGGSKAEGIKKIIEKFGLQKEQVYAFGDGLNDLEMLEFVGTGVAMGNGHPKAKEASDFVTKSVDEDGIEYGLKKLGLL
ncbi:Cof-type HAD-IIB family hydrolase [Bacillus sp. HMF5848]|uniref:Cof-type HAD-IIB family hydrolase n=1 Tax=Bacillus sp. HMF5848 TaxID=2495421 RepID=UPI000F7A9D29|nr:Cof-type HAD-IIB family hydrolase [Bacillus sp. HMF5848]RSK26865.1 Cof-type HAD-IIB family hydrolase [Bacillus sp. HMF5848]